MVDDNNDFDDFCGYKVQKFKKVIFFSYAYI